MTADMEKQNEKQQTDANEFIIVVGTGEQQNSDAEHISGRNFLRVWTWRFKDKLVFADGNRADWKTFQFLIIVIIFSDAHISQFPIEFWHKGG
jgi:hypothetical protein